MKNFRNYLQELGLSDLQGEERKAMYKSYKREYLRGYMKNKRTSNQVIEIYFTQKHYERLSQEALNQGLSRTAFCELVVLNAVCQTLWIPNGQVISELQVSIRKIGNNINQIAKISNYQKTTHPQLMDEAFQRLQLLEELIHKQLAHPELFLKS
jgi:hypothetical protein